MMQGKRSGKNRGNAPVFSDIDTNNDGSISQEEFRIHQSQRIQNNKNCADNNCPKPGTGSSTNQ
ncbi:MAG: hypothetical protein HKP62_06855 [Sulfurovum sp.]|nr:hypothetical protein [Sulfurovum sp.]